MEQVGETIFAQTQTSLCQKERSFGYAIEYVNVVRSSGHGFGGGNSGNNDYYEYRSDCYGQQGAKRIVSAASSEIRRVDRADDGAGPPVGERRSTTAAGEYDQDDDRVSHRGYGQKRQV